MKFQDKMLRARPSLSHKDWIQEFSALNFGGATLSVICGIAASISQLSCQMVQTPSISNGII